jgi:hypothetical protein
VICFDARCGLWRKRRWIVTAVAASTAQVNDLPRVHAIPVEIRRPPFFHLASTALADNDWGQKLKL